MNRYDDNGNALWVFGYGSLCWNPGFSYSDSTTGYVKGFSRRFWQGNATHRGTVEKRNNTLCTPRQNLLSFSAMDYAWSPFALCISYMELYPVTKPVPGRVATLIDDKKGKVYGRAFQIRDGMALPYLEKRECSLGGYLTTIATFHSRDGRQFPVIIYIATSKNEFWLGEASLQTIARQITECSGLSGHNVEYLLRLAEFMHRYLPEAHDEHLFTLEFLVRFWIKDKNMCLATLMGNRDFVIDLEDAEAAVGAEDRAEPNEQPYENSFQFSARIASKILRC